MPKPKRVLKRRTTKQQVNRRKNKRTTELLNELFDKDITNVPPHLLDKIPAGASLRPTAATLRQMTMQQLAPMYNPMPIFPQQQQAANLKNANDIREQTLNQSKQDFIKWYKRYCQISDSIDYTRHNKVLAIIPNDIQNCLFNIDKDYINDPKCCEKYTVVNVDKSLITIKESPVGNVIYNDFIKVKKEKQNLYSYNKTLC